MHSSYTNVLRANVLIKFTVILYIISKRSIWLTDWNLTGTTNPDPIKPNPSARTGYDTRSIFKRSLTGLNTEFSFS